MPCQDMWDNFIWKVVVWLMALLHQTGSANCRSIQKIKLDSECHHLFAAKHFPLENQYSYFLLFNFQFESEMPLFLQKSFTWILLLDIPPLLYEVVNVGLKLPMISPYPYHISLEHFRLQSFSKLDMMAPCLTQVSYDCRSAGFGQPKQPY